MKLLIIILGLLLSSCGINNKKSEDQVSFPPRSQEGEESNLLISQKDRVWIYKYDGSLQCNMGQEIPLKKMRKELQGIQVYREEKRSDGMVRIQLCGSHTGQANVYEIAKEDLEKAMGKGFELWKFN